MHRDVPCHRHGAAVLKNAWRGSLLVLSSSTALQHCITKIQNCHVQWLHAAGANPGCHLLMSVSSGEAALSISCIKPGSLCLHENLLFLGLWIWFIQIRFLGKSGEWEVKWKLILYFSHSAAGLLSVCVFFLSGFAKHISLPDLHG